jgi:hypothetical protein
MDLRHRSLLHLAAAAPAFGVAGAAPAWKVSQRGIISQSDD